MKDRASKPSGMIKYGVAEDELSKTATVGMEPNESVSEEDGEPDGE